jgi:hypothetical protein
MSISTISLYRGPETGGRFCGAGESASVGIVLEVASMVSLSAAVGCGNPGLITGIIELPTAIRGKHCSDYISAGMLKSFSRDGGVWRVSTM